MTDWNERPGTPPQFGQPPQYGQAPEYGQQPQYGQAPQYGQQPQYGQAPQYGQQPQAPYVPAPGGPSYLPPSGAPEPAAAGEDAPKKSKLPAAIGVVVAVVALVAGGLVFANSRGWFAAAGASSPTAAVQGLFDSLDKGDLLGVASQLAPTEARLSTDSAGGILDELKRLEIVQKSATVDQLYGLDIAVDGIVIGQSPIRISDTIQVIEVTSGRVTVTSDGTVKNLDDLLTPKIRELLPELTQRTPTKETFDIASDTAEIGGSLRIATIEENGRWYPSVFYTAADLIAYAAIGPDYAAKLAPIRAEGAASPEAAMDALVDAVIAGDTERLVAVLDPGTLGALQDYIGLALENEPGMRCLWNGLLDGGDASTGKCQRADVRVQDATWTSTPVTGGQKISVGTLTLQTPDGQVRLDRDPSIPSLTITTDGKEPIVVDPSQISQVIDDLTAQLGVTMDETDPQVRDLLERELKQLLNLGVVMVDGADGQWYVSPIHTYLDIVTSLLRGMEPADIDYFISLAHG